MENLEIPPNTGWGTSAQVKMPICTGTRHNLAQTAPLSCTISTSLHSLDWDFVPVLGAIGDAGSRTLSLIFLPDLPGYNAELIVLLPASS